MGAEEQGVIFKVLFGIYFVAFWIVLLWWLARRARRGDMPVPAAAGIFAYFWMFLEPMFSYLLLLRDLRRSERIRTFLKLADDLRIRKKGIDRRLPVRPRR